MCEVMVEPKGNEDTAKYTMVGIMCIRGGWHKKEKDGNAERLGKA